MATREQRGPGGSSAGLNASSSPAGGKTEASIAGCVRAPFDAVERADCRPCGAQTSNNAGPADLVTELPTVAKPDVASGSSGGSEAGEGSMLAKVKPGGAGSGAPRSVVLPLDDSSSGSGSDKALAAQVFLDDLAASCGLRQVSFSISRRSLSYSSGRCRSDVGVIEGVEAVDVARSTLDLLEDLASRDR
ncbi:unnamed protein product [Scytosiphon promiscuus]